MTKDKALMGYITAIIIVLIIALTVLSVSNHERDVASYVSSFTGPISAAVVLLGTRAKAKEAADNASDLSDAQKEEIEAIVIQALTDFSNGKKGSHNVQPSAMFRRD